MITHTWILYKLDPVLSPVKLERSSPRDVPPFGDVPGPTGKAGSR